MPRTEITEQDKGHYIHATCKTKWLRFTDDIEFLFNVEKKIIDVRSASRVGHSDFGVNRKRVENIRQKFIQKL